MNRLLPFFLLLLLTSSLFSLEPEPSAREDAMGGFQTSLADDFSSVFSNPAGIATLDPVLHYSSFDLRVTGTFWKITSVFTDDDVTKVFPLEEGTYVGIGLLGPVDIGYVGDGKAFRLKSYTSLDVLYPNLAVAADFQLTVGSSVTAGWGTGFYLSDSIRMDFGITSKFFHEQRYLGEGDFVELASIIQELGKLMDMPFQVVPGFGFDAGLITRFGDDWTASLAVKDLFTLEFVNQFNSTAELVDGGDPVARYLSIPIPNVSIGASWEPKISRVDWFSFTGFFLSFHHLFGGLEEYPVNYVLGLSMGTEMVFWNFLAFRMGFSEGLPSFGIGLSSRGFDFDLSLSGEELTNQPGVFSVTDIRLTMLFHTPSSPRK